MAPAELDEFQHGIDFLDVLSRWIALHPSARKRSVEDQVADAIRVSRRVGDRQPGSLTASEQDELLEPRRIDDRLEVAKAGVERQVFDVPLREAAASSVIARQGVVSGQLGKARRPDRAFPIVFQMVEPGRDLEHRWSAASPGIGEAHAVEGVAEAYLCRHEDTSGLAPRPAALWFTEAAMCAPVTMPMGNSTRIPMQN